LPAGYMPAYFNPLQREAGDFKIFIFNQLAWNISIHSSAKPETRKIIRR